MRASTLAGVAIVLVAAAILGLIAFADRSAGGTPVAAAPSTGLDALPTAAQTRVRAASTLNVYASPDRSAEVVAVLPSGQLAEADGRASDGDWVRVTYPIGSSTRGWARATALVAASGDLAALPVTADVPTSRPAAEPKTAARALPDLAIADAFLLQGEKLAVVIRNVGAATLTEATVVLNVSRVEGDVVGVLRIGPMTLVPGAAATVVTPLAVADAGSYRLELDPANEIAEAQKSNNSYTGLLVPNRG